MRSEMQSKIILYTFREEGRGHVAFWKFLRSSMKRKRYLSSSLLTLISATIYKHTVTNIKYSRISTRLECNECQSNNREAVRAPWIYEFWFHTTTAPWFRSWQSLRSYDALISRKKKIVAKRFRKRNETVQLAFRTEGKHLASSNKRPRYFL